MTTMTMTDMEIALRLKAEMNPKYRPRIWQSPDGARVRVYTGLRLVDRVERRLRAEYLEVAGGNVSTSQARIAWGLVVDEVLADLEADEPSQGPYTTRGLVRGACGHQHRTLRAAVRCIERDLRQVGTDREVVRADGSPLNEGEARTVDAIANGGLDPL